MMGGTKWELCGKGSNSGRQGRTWRRITHAGRSKVGISCAGGMGDRRGSVGGRGRQQQAAEEMAEDYARWQEEGEDFFSLPALSLLGSSANQ